jgi:hypothetical protein
MPSYPTCPTCKELFVLCVLSADIYAKREIESESFLHQGMFPKNATNVKCYLFYVFFIHAASNNSLEMTIRDAL